MFQFEARLDVKQIIVNIILSLLIVTVIYSYFVDYEKIKNSEWTTKVLSDQLSSIMEYIFQSNNSNSSGLKNLEKQYITELENFQLKMKSDIENTINSMKMYEKFDRTERADYALENSGGSIHSYNATLFASMFNMLIQNGPKKLIQSSMEPGECFGFVGDKASVTIKLLGSVFVDSLTVEHITSKLSPLENIKSAPKEFVVCGHKEPNDLNHTHLGSFIYKINVPETIQTFYFTKKSQISLEYVKIHFLSNHGSKNTCVYRIRIHGTLDKKSKLDTKF